MNGRHFAWLLAAGLLALPGAAPVESAIGQATESAKPHSGHQDSNDKRQSRRRPKWWMDEKLRAELGITDAQSARIEEIWQSTLPTQQERFREFRRLDSALSKLIKEGTADPTIVAQQVERVENLRAEMTKTRTITLYRMHRELTQDQRAKLKAMDERRDAERRKTTESEGHRH